MDTDDPKKYNIFENILQKVNQKYIALPDAETKRNNRLLIVIDKIIQKMRSNNPLFDNLFQSKYYGGSFYDNLKIGKPVEYDLDCLLCLPKAALPTVEQSDKPGYVQIALNIKALEKQADVASKYVGLDKLLEGDRLSTKKVKSWIESVMASALSGTPKISIKIDEAEYIVKATSYKSGPALTINLKGDIDGTEFNIDVDLVPSFKFFDDQWPQESYRKNTSKSKNTFFVVPKSPNETETLYWRLSFQEQEKELISNYAVMKPTIRLIKKIRDRYQHKIASYFIKTIFLWELEKNDKSFWQKPLSFVFMIMLRKYAEYVTQKNIPYYWNDNYNLIEDLPDITASCIANKLKNIRDEVDRTCCTNPYGIVQFFLSQSECNIENFKQEVYLGKKHQGALKSSSENKIAEPTLPSPSSSVSSSCEEVTKEVVIEQSSPQLEMSKLELLLTNLCSAQNHVMTLLEVTNSKIDSLEDQIKQLRDDFEAKKVEDQEEKKELMNMIKMLSKRDEPKDDPFDFLVSSNDILKRTADFQNL